MKAIDRLLLVRWHAAPHVTEWWGAPEGLEQEEQAPVAKWIVELNGRPFAYAQDYDPHAWPRHHFGYLPPGSRGIDQFIGEADMLDHGHGSAFVRQHVARLFAAGAPAVGTDPHPDNRRAVRAYEKAGFRLAGGPLETRWGKVLLMECRKETADCVRG